MKRTLLAVGVAVLASLMYIPENHGVHCHVPIIFPDHYGAEWGQLILQTIFLAVLAVSTHAEMKHVYEVRPRTDRRGVDLISDVLPFGQL